MTVLYRLLSLVITSLLTITVGNEQKELSYEQLSDLINQGLPLPGIRDIDDMPNDNVELVSGDVAPEKPWKNPK